MIKRRPFSLGFYTWGRDVRNHNHDALKIARLTLTRNRQVVWSVRFSDIDIRGWVGPKHAAEILNGQTAMPTFPDIRNGSPLTSDQLTVLVRRKLARRQDFSDLLGEIFYVRAK